MSPSFRKIARRIFIFLHILTAICCLLVCLIPWLGSGDFWFIAMMGIGFPFLVVFLIVFLVVWAIKRSRWAFLSVITLLLCFQQISVIMAWRTEKDFNTDEKSDNVLRVLSWNVSRWDETNKAARGGASFRALMMDFVQMQNADVICLQEFFECYAPDECAANIPAITKMGYPYHYFFPSSKIFENKYQFGLCIFSRYPIIDSAQFLNGAQVHAEGFCYVDIKVREQMVRVYTTHLESVGFGAQDYEGLGKLEGSRGIIGKVKRSYLYRNEQAKGMRMSIAQSPYPAVVCGDLDDVPNSFAYFHVKGDLQDAFLKKGSGLGRTFALISPTLRIDYIFADRRFKVKQYACLRPPYSDHYPQITDLELPVTP